MTAWPSAEPGHRTRTTYPVNVTWGPIALDGHAVAGKRSTLNESGKTTSVAVT
jgi:hypothetical protein